MKSKPEVQVRKQVDNLLPQDLEDYPVWEFVYSEENPYEITEATVTACEDISQINVDESNVAIKTVFKANDGTVYIGYLFPENTDDIGYIQPTITTELGQVNFWMGMYKADVKFFEESYKILNKNAGKLFPIKYKSEIPYKGKIISGEIKGFTYSPDPNNNMMVEIQ